MKITCYRHSCFAAEISGKHLLFDPFITQNPLAKTIDIKKINADYIFVSHAARNNRWCRFDSHRTRSLHAAQQRRPLDRAGGPNTPGPASCMAP
jgi:hypothetical protein